MSGMLVNQLVTSDVFFHWLSFVVFLIVELILSRICLLTLPSSLFAGFMRRHVGWLEFVVDVSKLYVEYHVEEICFELV